MSSGKRTETSADQRTESAVDGFVATAPCINDCRQPSESPNDTGGFCSLPIELTLEIVSYYPRIDISTFTPRDRPRRRVDSQTQPRSRNTSSSSLDNPGLPRTYLERPAILRALCGVCKAYRSTFLPLLWENLDICVSSRTQSSEDGEVVEVEPEPFHKSIGEAMVRKCSGLLEYQNLAAMVRTVNVVLTRHRMEEALQAFAKCLEAMPNLHTIHVLDANPQMPKAIGAAFKNVDLPSVRAVIIPGICHELLSSCPHVERVWCNQGTGHKLSTVIRMFCKKVTEVRGLRCEETLDSMKSFVQGLPDLRVIELNAPMAEDVIQLLPTLKKLQKIDVRIPAGGGAVEERDIQRTIKSIASTLARPTLEINAIIPEAMVGQFVSEPLNPPNTQSPAHRGMATVPIHWCDLNEGALVAPGAT